MEKKISYQEFYDYQFAYGNHGINNILNSVLEKCLKRDDLPMIENHIERLIDSGIDENLNNASFLLLLLNPATGFIERGLNCPDHLLRLKIIFELRKRGGMYFDLEIEEYILSCEDLQQQIEMTEVYNLNTGKGWTVYRELLLKYKEHPFREKIIKSIAGTGLTEMKWILKRFCDFKREDFEISSIFALGLLSPQDGLDFLVKYFENIEFDEKKICKCLQEFRKFILSISIDENQLIENKFIEKLILEFNKHIGKDSECHEITQFLSMQFLSNELFNYYKRYFISNDSIFQVKLRFMEISLYNLRYSMEEVNEIISLEKETKKIIYKYINDSEILDVLIDREKNDMEMLEILLNKRNNKIDDSILDEMEKRLENIESCELNRETIEFMIYELLRNDRLNEELIEKLFLKF